ncbi:MAG: hypothetical protein ACXVBE_03900 [Bdellovibrionota bacterium]
MQQNFGAPSPLQNLAAVSPVSSRNCLANNGELSELRRHMNNIYFYCAALSSLFLCACSTGATHQIWAGGRADSYTETAVTPLDTSLAKALGGTVTTLSGDPSKIHATGIGGQAGVMEQSGPIASTLAVFFVDYPAFDYSFSSSSYGLINTSTKVSGWGFDGSVGYDLTSFFRPLLAYKLEFQSSDTAVTGSAIPATSSSTSHTRFFVGAGAAVEIPITDSVHFVLQAAYLVPASKDKDTASAHSLLGQAGVRIANF